MSSHPTPIDISNMPDLLDIVEEMKASKKPRILKKGSRPVAMLMPMDTTIQAHKTIDMFDFKPLDKIRASFLEAGYSKAEVDDMVEAMSELQQYAGTAIKKSE